jgi:hypothetical protein
MVPASNFINRAKAMSLLLKYWIFSFCIAILASTVQAQVKLEFGLDAQHYNYLEPKIIQMQGVGVGVFIGISKSWEEWTGNIDVFHTKSKLNYNSNGTGTLDDISDTLTQWRLVMQRHINANLIGWSPYMYTGWGKRSNKNDFIGVTTTGQQAYRRTNERTYMPLGVKITRATSSSDSADEWSLSAETRYVLSGEHTTHLTDVGAEQDNTSEQKGRGWSVQVGRNWGPWRLTAYANQWDMDATNLWQSKINGFNYSLREPANQTWETGVRLSRFF